MAGMVQLPEEWIVEAEGVDGCPCYGRRRLGGKEEYHLRDLFGSGESRNISFIIRVSVGPGQTALTSTPCCFTSAARQ